MALDIQQQVEQEFLRYQHGLFAARHYGPGDHPGTGNPQGAHGGSANAMSDIGAGWAANFARAGTSGEDAMARSYQRWQSTFEDCRQIQLHPESDDAIALAAAVNRSPAVQGAVYRGFKVAGRDLKQGDRLTFHNPVSASPHIGIAHEYGDTIFEISGADVRDLSAFSHFQGFEEVIVKPARFGVAGVRQSGIYTTPTGKGPFDAVRKLIVTIVPLPEGMT